MAGHSAIPVVEHSAPEQRARRFALPRPSRLRLPTLRLPEGFPRRAAAIAAALAIELLILLLLLSLGVGGGVDNAETTSVATFDAAQPPRPETPEAEEQTADPADPADPAAPAAPQDPVPATPQQPSPLTLPPTALPRESTVFIPPAPPAPPQPEAEPAPPAPPRATAVIRPGAQYGPANTPRAGGAPDSEVVGRAPDGSPLYAARWYREPTNQELAGYLSAARGPGWGLIACKTAPNWRVEDCVIVGESPAGSLIARSAQAAAWQFQVRPPRVGGSYQVGAWVRIRITYALAPGAG